MFIAESGEDSEVEDDEVDPIEKDADGNLRIPGVSFASASFATPSFSASELEANFRNLRTQKRSAWLLAIVKTISSAARLF